ncbi:MAG: deoxyribonuclease IV [Armatimonadota bacterium]|nr:deoxyribonuclease IV [Armatimonadota bacterium]
MPRLIGAHMPTSGGGVPKAILDGAAIGCGAVQVFTSSPRQWASKMPDAALIAESRKAMKDTGIDFVVAHDTYLVNLCAPTDDIRQKSIKTLTDELTRCSQLGIRYVVSHMGSLQGQTFEEGMQKLVAATAQILDSTPKDVCLAMETTAGQGSALGWQFEHWAMVIEALGGDPRLVICWDTCHLFAAGYAVHQREGFEETVEGFHKLIGLERLRIIHANDSLKPFASRLDRHQHIGEGLIGSGPFSWFVNDPRLAHAPLILETNEPEEMHPVNLQRLRSMVKE